MMKVVIPVVLFFLGSTPSLASTSTSPESLVYLNHFASKTRTLTKNELARYVSRVQRRFLIDDNEDNLPPGPDELDLQSLYSRNRIEEKIKKYDPDQVSDYVALRLAIARAKALAKYREIWG